jgi:hypothetical protein
MSAGGIVTARAVLLRVTGGYWAGVQYNNKTMSHHFGAAHSCSIFADLLIKNIQRFKTN